jgi:hypothetical protein
MAFGAGDLFRAIPDAAANPRALAAYTLALLVWAALAWRERRYRLTLEHIKSLPAKDRAATVARDLGEPVPPELSAEQFLRYKKQQNLFRGLLVIPALLAVIVVIALTRDTTTIHNDKSPQIGTVQPSATVNITYEHGRPPGP